MSAATASFDSWLIGKLTELNTDEGVFGSYIRGILEGDESHDEKTEALEGILAGITEDEISKHVSEILDAWSELGLVKHEVVDDAPKEDVDVRLARMLESQNLATTSHKSNQTAEERRIKEAILAQYSQMSDQEESEDEDNEDPGGGGGGGGGGDSGLAKNTNVSDIFKAQKEQRERAKLESARKKEKDKEDREKQKLAKEEKKEKRKTHKGERRR